MPTPYRRKSVKLPKQKKIVVKKRTWVVLVGASTTSKKYGVKMQELHRRRDREKLKREFKKGKISKENRKLLSYIKKYKSAAAKKATAEMVAAMQGKYSFREIKWAKKTFSIVGKNVQTAWDGVPIEKYSADGKRGKVNGKWISKKKINAMYKRATKKARINSYMDILGITKEKAKKILNIIDKKLPGVNELKALIY